MTKQLKLSALAVAIGAIMSAPAFASDHWKDHRHDPNSSVAAVTNFQGISGSSYSTSETNRGTLKGNALRGASGNIGVNVAGSNTSTQTNNAAISTAPGKTTTTFAGILNDQDPQNATVTYMDVTNRATLKGNALRGASGNIGVNVLAGDQNEQTNNLAIAKGQGTKSGRETNALAMIFTSQSMQGCQTGVSATGTHNNSDVTGSALRGASGNIGVNVASGAQNEQANGAAISKNKNGSNSFAFTMVSQQTMGTINCNNPDPCLQIDPLNSATVGGNVLRGASGNIGMNVASGYGNMQSNTLAISTSNP